MPLFLNKDISAGGIFFCTLHRLNSATGFLFSWTACGVQNVGYFFFKIIHQLDFNYNQIYIRRKQ